ncbi:MAG: HAMP domain-containing sensor histidine kinase, partial [Planctomycetota bacterium]|nr:HAMP domain-containing sensor histidine kinase [Planctomycetota bacterium]
EGPPPLREGEEPAAESPWAWAYGPDLTSANSAAPTLPAAYAEAMRSGEAHVGGTFRHRGWDGYEVLVRMTWDTGPCAFVLLRSYGKRLPGLSRDLLWAGVVLCGVLLLAVLFAAGPLVRRVRRLEEEVRQAAAERYARPIEVTGDDEISALAGAFNDAGTQLRAHLETIEEREKSLRRFVANTTHDVMIPLTVLQGDLSRIRNDLDADRPVDRENVVQALEEAHYMGSLMHNLSAVSKLEGGGYTVRTDPVDLNALVSRAAGRHLPMANARGIQLEYGVPEETLETIGDVTLLEQAVSNLIHNAVRYNEHGGHVAVILETPSGTPERFFLTVVDDGPGIPDEELARLPERRFRGEMARQRHPGGLGLGLHIARDVARRHGFALSFRRSSYDGLEVELSGPVRVG